MVQLKHTSIIAFASLSLCVFDFVTRLTLNLLIFLKIYKIYYNNGFAKTQKDPKICDLPNTEFCSGAQQVVKNDLIVKVLKRSFSYTVLYEIKVISEQ